MSRVLSINGTPYTFPDQGADPPWGEEVSEWAQAVTDVLGTLVNENDILNSVFNIGNGQTNQNIVGLYFDINVVRSAIIEYSIHRQTDSFTLTETGTLLFSYNNSDIYITRESDNDAGVTFDVTSLGQFRYTSTTISGTNYAGVIKFRAKTFEQ